MERRAQRVTDLITHGENHVRVTASGITNRKIHTPLNPNPEKSQCIVHRQKILLEKLSVFDSLNHSMKYMLVSSETLTGRKKYR